ncbi:unnamed protein product [Tilletia controversa]|uniref:Uncharacterized protein n=3 Tax=Tilletia TaxID=13289 RepID=A0A8X7SYK3_9BASI|nr:hypothetical protein CF336_g2519 [Tilletia laevis]KAE8202193.1 hypothetical protein CF328_g2359 [Tilletia controversa]KAE8243434.1 hypothetical protein A4X03_0g7766 [Tilletia caries]KAE8205188.1 hypothetical protein CF335_g2395 [Tilletia laevis]KAE8249956.1 hypothetical protein A4X06_0g2985 [Tilletia controversa]
MNPAVAVLLRQRVALRTTAALPLRLSQPGLRFALPLSPRRPYSTESQPQQSKKNALQTSLSHIRTLAHKHGSDPASLLTSFLILHELTALLPLLLLFWLFELVGTGQGLLSWLATTTEEAGGQAEAEGGYKALVRGWVDEGVRTAERVGRRYGLFGIDKSSTTTAGTEASPQSGALVGSFANAVAAYACVKALIPLRLAASVALAPAFARYTIEPIKRLAARWRGRSPANPVTPSSSSSAASPSPTKPSRPDR